MSYDAKVFNVMIASPGDVASERSIIRDVIYEWNAVHSKNRNIVLLPVGWESHSSPEMGGKPQGIINNQILDKCDLLVGVFWTRIGTATDEYVSGSVEEIEKHISSKKPVMLYFSDQPVRMDSVDQPQYTALQEFKNSCKSRGLCEKYDSHSEFKDKFYRHLQLKVNEHEIFQVSGDASEFSQEIHESNTNIPDLSNEARILLKEASLDSHGKILCTKTYGGTDFHTNGKSLIPDQSRRTVAAWESALQELVVAELLIEVGHTGQMLNVTNLGYQVADMIEM